MSRTFKDYYRPRLGFVVSYCSERLRGRAERVRARQDMRRGIEPQPRYTTGKFWTD